jgi:hypothetical protein
VGQNPHFGFRIRNDAAPKECMFRYHDSTSLSGLTMKKNTTGSGVCKGEREFG